MSARGGHSQANGAINTYVDRKGNLMTTAGGVIMGPSRDFLAASSLVTSAGFAAATEASLTNLSARANGKYTEVQFTGVWTPSVTGQCTATVSLPALIRPLTSGSSLTYFAVRLNNGTTNVIPTHNTSVAVVNDAATNPALRLSISPGTNSIPASTTYAAQVQYLR